MENHTETLEQSKAKFNELKQRAIEEHLNKQRKLLMTTMLTGNITTNFKHGIPLNYNVNYTQSLPKSLVQEITDLETKIRIQERGGEDA